MRLPAVNIRNFTEQSANKIGHGGKEQSLLKYARMYQLPYDFNSPLKNKQTYRNIWKFY